MTGELAPEELEGLKERGSRQVAAIDAAIERGEIGEEGWHRAMSELIVPAYLAGDNPRAQSGHSGDAVRWEGARRLLLDAVAKDGSFLDVGCANGHLMECLHRWAAEDGVTLEPVRSRDLARAGGPRGRSAPALAGADLRRQCARLAAAEAIRLRPDESRLRPTAEEGWAPRPSAERRRGALRPADRRRVQRGDRAEGAAGGRELVGIHDCRSRGASSSGHGRARSAGVLGRRPAAVGREPHPAKFEGVAGARPSPAAAGPPGSAVAAGRPAASAAWFPSPRALLVALLAVLAGVVLYVGARETSVFAIDRIEVEGVSPGVAARVRALSSRSPVRASSPSTRRTAAGASRRCRWSRRRPTTATSRTP